MEKRILPTIEVKIYEKTNFIVKYLNIRNKFKDSKQDIPLINKNQVLDIFKELGYPCKYVTGGSYRLNWVYKNHEFILNAIIDKFTSVLLYSTIFIDGEPVTGREGQISALLWHLPYDENMLNKNFRLNSLEDLKNYLSDMIGLFNEFVDAYIEALKMEEAAKEGKEV